MRQVHLDHESFSMSAAGGPMGVEGGGGGPGLLSGSTMLTSCLGAPLARLETAIVVEELLAMVPRFEVVTPDEELDHPRMLFLRSPRTLVLRPVR